MMLKFNLKIFFAFIVHIIVLLIINGVLDPHDVIEIIIYEALDIFWELFNSFACLLFLKSKVPAILTVQRKKLKHGKLN